MRLSVNYFATSLWHAYCYCSYAMAYRPRYEVICDDAYFHVTWQCHNGDWLLQWDWAKKFYYDLLLKYKDKYGIEFYSYNFMDNHPHLAGHMHKKERFSGFFRTVNSLFAKKVNKQLNRRGQVIMDRFKSPMVESDEHMLNVMAYIDLNPHRVGKFVHPNENDWSSYAYYAHGKKDPLITPSLSFLALGRNERECRTEYIALVEAMIAHRGGMNISHTYFIGSHDWVLKKYRELCEKFGRKFIPARFAKMLDPP